MREALAGYVKRVTELAEHVKGNEQATKQSLIAPLFTLLGYDLTDPRECMPEYKVDFGKERSSKPIDWAFLQGSRPVFFVEAKEVGKKLGGYDEQLADYFAKAPEAKVGILTNGVQWRFFTDIVNENVMDKEPFIKWDVLGDEPPPFDFLTLLQKSQYNPQLIRTFAERKRAQNLLVNELARLLEPAPEFTKLAIANIETRNLTANVVESWKPIVANAINEWAKQHTLSSVLNAPRGVNASESATDEAEKSSKIETTQEELDAFALVSRLLGDRKVAYTDTVTYFKIHLVERHTWVVCRLYLGRKRPKVWLPLATDRVQPALPGMDVTTPEPGWACITLESPTEVEKLGEVLKVAWDQQRADHPAPTPVAAVPV
ncbi:MAG: hypothetical protein HY901_19580 [Deltaproteobacteria bacterium]|nr:hypothetical protein [Deltaproteobacteria bacterium]